MWPADRQHEDVVLPVMMHLGLLVELQVQLALAHDVNCPPRVIE